MVNIFIINLKNQLKYDGFRESTLGLEELLAILICIVMGTYFLYLHFKQGFFVGKGES